MPTGSFTAIPTPLGPIASVETDREPLPVSDH